MSSPNGRQLTTTSYAILGLLATRPWSTYELTKQMRRSLHHIWPRAESNIYAESKRLVEAGLARAEVEAVGRRPRTLYTITAKGRRVLRSWLATESAPSRLESETLVKVLFGNSGTKDVLLVNLRAFALEAERTLELWRAVAEEYDRGTHAFPERVHMNSLLFRWLSEQAELNARWAQWAIERVESWPDVTDPQDVEASLDVFRSALSSHARQPSARSSR
jgi:DNA-binding PadR family transcriptional regulator